MKFLAYSGKLLFQPVFWGGFWTATVFLIIYFLIIIFQGFNFFDIKTLIIIFVPYFVIGMLISFFLCLVLLFVSRVFFQNPLEEEVIYRFTLYIAAFISSLIFSSLIFSILVSFLLSISSRRLIIEDILFGYWESRVSSIFVSVGLSHFWASNYLVYLGKKNKRLEDPWD